MQKDKKWEVINKFKVQSSKFKVNDIITVLLDNRGIKTKKEIKAFLHPKLEDVTVESVDIDKKQLAKSLKRIQKAIEEKEKIIVYGDYDVDGITGTAILWETLHGLGAHVLPYIPHRVDEGYGLSIKGLENVQTKFPDCSVIITVDNGIVANDAVKFAKKLGMDVIITDHHTIGEKEPEAFAIVHTTKLCGASVAYLLSQNIKNENTEHLDLVALATVADLVPLTRANRTLLKTGLDCLRNTNRIGLKELFYEAGIDPRKIGVYEIGHIIAPRMNAMGRLESAMDSLRLLCTKNPEKAKLLANKLGVTNRERQLLTQASALHAIERVKGEGGRGKNLLFIAEETYEEGIIGLIAGKLVEVYYKPSIVIAKGEKISKASARSVSGFNIIAFIRMASDHLINAGGHPMAAGFTVETEKIELLQEALEKLAQEHVHDGLLTRILKIDCEIPLEMITQELYDSLQQLAPFGMANPEPTFVSRDVIIEDVRAIGREKNHLKLLLKSYDSFKVNGKGIEGIAFGMGERIDELKPGSRVDIAYVIEENEWNGRKKLQIKIKDIKMAIDKK